MSFGDFLGGLWDTAVQDVTQAAPQILNSKLRSQFGGKDHIPAQNATVAEMARALNNFNASSPHSDIDYAQFESEIQFDAATFANYVQQYFPTARGQRGVSDVQNLANALIRDRETERANLRLSQGQTPQPLPYVPTPTGSGIPGQPPPGGYGSGTHVSQSSGSGILAVLGAAWLFLRGK